MCGPIYSFSQLVFEHLCARCFVGETRGNDMYGLRSCEAYILVGETAENTTTSTIKRENFRMWWGEGGSKQLMESRLARVGQKRLLWRDVIWNEPLGHEITHLCKGKGRELISTRVEMGNSVVWSRSWKQSCLPGVNGEKWSWRGGRKEDGSWSMMCLQKSDCSDEFSQIEYNCNQHADWKTNHFHWDHWEASFGTVVHPCCYLCVWSN